ncbi:hypothetical protein AOQ84DRAFT_94002 [Glonium stellatum]|uniref:NACHT-NTPase and P-loop NTPases N-terminal domain-containing protein n=1 Tax=Glonium stellatum TaxID=574774 RepID=A0A8E2JQD2_9PEZI|nr:hypothetical protein AOQ84DRAFT_94002 [Glonium stellatum]
MSGLEVLGILASASQLTEYCIMIITSVRDIYKLVRGRPNRYGRQLQQIEHLIETTKLVQATEYFHTPSVKKQLCNILEEAKGLQKILGRIVSDSERKSKKYYLKAAFPSYHERAMVKGFASLHEKESTLVLCIVSTYGAFLLDIRNGTAEELPTIRKKVEQIDKTLESFPDISSEVAKMQNQLSDMAGDLSCMRVSGGSISSKAPHQRSNSSLETQNRGSRALTNFKANSDASDESAYSMPTPVSRSNSPTIIPLEQNQHIGFPDMQTLTTYSNVYATDNSYQLNGNIGGNFSKVFVRKHYEGITAQHNSRQINGDIIDPSFAMKFFQS